MVNFYRRFIPHAAKIMMPLNNLLKGSNKDNAPLKLNETAEEAFVDIKEGKGYVIGAPEARRPYEHNCQCIRLCNRRSVTTTNKRYLPAPRLLRRPFPPCNENTVRMSYRELLAAYYAIKHFRLFIEGQNFILYTDHKPLTFAVQQNLEKCSPRQFRYLDFISQYITDIRYIQGAENKVTDALSRVEAISCPPDHSALEKAQEQD